MIDPLYLEGIHQLGEMSQEDKHRVDWYLRKLDQWGFVVSVDELTRSVDISKGYEHYTVSLSTMQHCRYNILPELMRGFEEF